MTDIKQHYDVWNPFEEHSLYIAVESLIDDWEGFRVLMRELSTGAMFRLRFPGHIAYRMRDETEFSFDYPPAEGLGRGCFYIGRSTRYRDEYVLTGIRDCKQLMHYVIVTDTDCVEVLTLERPVAEQLPV
jgi:hypothetical protein